MLQQSEGTERPARVDDAALWRAIGFLTERHWRAVAALLLLSLVCFLPGLASIPPVDRDEARFVQATKQMLETGDYVDIRMHDEPRYKKPVGIYWLQAAAVRLTGHGADAPIWAYRLASLAGALTAVLLAYWTGLALFGTRAAFLGAAFLAASMILTVEAHLAKTDAVLLATVLLAQGAAARIYLAPNPRMLPLHIPLLFWIGNALGVLVKGPVTPMVTGLTLLGLAVADRGARWWRGLRPAIGLPVALAIVLPWFVAILSIAGSRFLQESAGHDLLGKVATGQESHGAPPGTHLLLLWLVIWPGALLIFLALPWMWRSRRQAPVRFCLMWIVPSWIVFEAVATKLPHYTLPLLPAVLLLAAAAAEREALGWPGRWLALLTLPSVLFALALIAAALWGLYHLQGVVSVGALLCAIGVVACAAGAAAMGLRGQPLAAAGFLLASALPIYLGVFAFVFPRLEKLWLAPRVAQAIERAATCAAPEVVSTGYEEASLVFAVGTKIRFVSPAAAADFLAQSGCRLALVEGRREAEFQARAQAAGVSPRRSETVEGLNIGNMARMAVAVYRPENMQATDR